MSIEYGWPLPKRQEYFLDLKNDPAAKLYDAKIEFMNTEYILPVWRVPIELPKYRLMNGRTSSLQQEWLANNSGKQADFFNADPEREEAQRVQHELLKRLINEADLLPHFEKGNKQTEYIILDSFGFVVNGNRRLCTWRELLDKGSTAGKYDQFKQIDVIVLPKADEKSIDVLEATLQVKRNIRADYSWHALANMLVDRQKTHDMNELMRIYEMSKADIENYIDMHKYAVEYMKARGKVGQWTSVDGKEFAFEKIVKIRKKITLAGEKRIFEAGAYILLDDPAGDRLYESIPDLYKYQADIAEALSKKFTIENAVLPTDNLLGVNAQELKSLKLAEKVDLNEENRRQAREIIKDTIETRRSLDKEKDSADYVLKQLQKASAAIQSALLGAGPNATRTGIKETIKTIEDSIAEIQKWLGNG